MEESVWHRQLVEHFEFNPVFIFCGDLNPCSRSSAHRHFSQHATQVSLKLPHQTNLFCSFVKKASWRQYELPYSLLNFSNFSLHGNTVCGNESVSTNQIAWARDKKKHIPQNFFAITIIMSIFLCCYLPWCYCLLVAERFINPLILRDHKNHLDLTLYCLPDPLVLLSS